LPYSNGTQNYGGQSGAVANMAGFMMECLNTTEMAVHDYGNVIHSFMYYSGSTFTIGRNMGWGNPNVVIPANVNAGSVTTLGIVSISAINNYDGGNITKLRVYASDNSGISAIFKHPNDTQGIGIAYDGLVALNTNQSINIKPSGAGRFEVSASTNNTGTITNLSYFGNNLPANTLPKANTNFGDCCAKFNGSIWATSWVGASSDTRIKQNIQDINDNESLDIILAIQPKKYEYIDKIEKGDKKVYGFLAQQIKEVLPEAVSIQKSYIPNIMLLADYNDKIITLPSQPNYIIKINDKIKCNDKNNNMIEYEVLEIIDELTFKVKCDPMKEVIYTDTKIFVYGVEIDDFHTLSKEYIFTLNVCATQELHRIIQSQQVIIQSQEDRIKDLEIKMTQILNIMPQ
jgi:hypothetical protein